MAALEEEHNAQKVLVITIPQIGQKGYSLLRAMYCMQDIGLLRQRRISWFTRYICSESGGTSQPAMFGSGIHGKHYKG